MAEIKKTGVYYSLKERCRRVSHQLSLSLSDEEYDRHRKAYKSLLRQWKQLERQEEKPLGEPPGYWYYAHRPVFDETYVESTLQLKEMYKARKSMTHSERHKSYDALNAAIARRRRESTYIETQAG